MPPHQACDKIEAANNQDEASLLFLLCRQKSTNNTTTATGTHTMAITDDLT